MATIKLILRKILEEEIKEMEIMRSIFKKAVKKFMNQEK